MTYQQAFDATHRGCFVFLVDQSYSMLEPAVGRNDRSKAQATADTLNACLSSLLGTPADDRRPLPFDLGVLGYGHDVRSGLAPPLDERVLVPAEDVARHPLPHDTTPRSDTLGHAPTTSGWIRPTASGGTPMTAALEQCHDALAPWVASHPASFPPVVINISDGEPTDGDPAPAADRLRALSTDDGPALLFNVSLSARAHRPVLFASHDEDLPTDAARRLFHLSSPLPACMAEVAARLGHPTRPGARGIVCHADLAALGILLDVGTSPASRPAPDLAAHDPRGRP